MASAKSRPECGFCRRGKEVNDTCGPLHKSDDCAAHHKCMQYSALLTQYQFSHFGGFKIKKVLSEIARGKYLKCHVCTTGVNGQKFKKVGGATAGCAIKKCRHTYHFYCAAKANQVITRRIEVAKGNKGKKVVLYRVFCSEEHLRLFEKEVNDLRYLKEDESSDSDGEEESDSDVYGTVDTPNSQGDAAKVHVTESDSPKGFCFQPKIKAIETTTWNIDSSEDSSSSFEDILADLDTKIHTVDVESDDSDAHTSGTSAKDLKSQPFISDSLSLEQDNNQDTDSSSDDSSICILNTTDFQASPRRSPRRSGHEHTEVNLSENSKIAANSSGKKQESMADSLKERKESIKKEETSSGNEGKAFGVGSAQLLGTITAVRSESGTDSAKELNKNQRSAVAKDINKKCSEHMKTEARVVLTDIKKTNSSNKSERMSKQRQSKRSRGPNDSIILDDLEEPKAKKVCSEVNRVSIISRDENDSEGYGSAAEVCSKRARTSSTGFTPQRELTKVVNSKVPKSVSCREGAEAPSVDCVLCFLEHESSENVEYNRFISPIAIRLFGVEEDSVYLWKFKADDSQVTADHMVYFMKDISKALRAKQFKLLSEMLCDLEGERIHNYDSPVQFNEEYDPELKEELYHKLRESIKENLAEASNALGQKIGSIHYFKSLKTHVVFLYLSDVIDCNRKIRNRLGHKNQPFVWTPDEEDIEFAYPTLTSETRNTIRNNEYEVLLRWLKFNIRKPRLLTRPNSKEPYLLMYRRQSLAYRMRTVLEELSSDAQDAVDVITIGPLNTEVLRVWPYLQKCIPAVIEDRLTARKEIYMIYDVDSRELSSMQSLVPRLPDHVDYKVFCGQDPSKTPITCVLLQVILNQDNVSSSNSTISESSSVSSSTSSDDLRHLGQHTSRSSAQFKKQTGTKPKK